MPTQENYLKKNFSSRELLAKCAAIMGGRMKKKIGHLPTEFTEITPLNSAEFLY
jgi:hypothetical protein